MASLIIVTDDDVQITTNIPVGLAIKLGQKHADVTGNLRWNVVLRDTPDVIINDRTVR
jgi:hypothetical protein